MKSKFLRLLVAVVLTIMAYDIAYAGNSQTIHVSCTVPSIPGVNAPALETSQQGHSNLPSLAEENKAQEGTSQQGEMIEEETRQEIMLAQDQGESLKLQTVYMR